MWQRCRCLVFLPAAVRDRQGEEVTNLCGRCRRPAATASFGGGYRAGLSPSAPVASADPPRAGPSLAASPPPAATDVDLSYSSTSTVKGR
jgi:hypothetical protein